MNIDAGRMMAEDWRFLVWENRLRLIDGEW
jgi:hypothetical protein